MSAGEYSKGRRPPRVENYTPIPTNRLNSLTEAVTRIDENVKSFKEDLLPPLTADTKEARDKAREALTKIDDHVGGVSHEHDCSETDRQERQDSDLAELRSLSPRVAGMSKVFWAIIAALVTGVTSAVGFALVTKAQAATNAARIEAQASADQRHDSLIRAMQRLREEDRREFVTLVQELPRRVVDAKAPAQQVDDAAEALPLTEVEQRQVEVILRRARRRGGDNVKR